MQSKEVRRQSAVGSAEGLTWTQGLWCLRPVTFPPCSFSSVSSSFGRSMSAFSFYSTDVHCSCSGWHCDICDSSRFFLLRSSQHADKQCGQTNQTSCAPHGRFSPLLEMRSSRSCSETATVRTSAHMSPVRLPWMHQQLTL